MGIGAFHNVVISPIVIVFQIGKLVEYGQVFVDIFLVRISASRTVYNGNDLCTGDIVIRLESAVRIAVEPAYGFSERNI